MCFEATTQNITGWQYHVIRGDISLLHVVMCFEATTQNITGWQYHVIRGDISSSSLYIVFRGLRQRSRPLWSTACSAGAGMRRARGTNSAVCHFSLSLSCYFSSRSPFMLHHFYCSLDVFCFVWLL
jgi:hypothetical protein